MADEDIRPTDAEAPEGLPDEEFSRLMNGISTMAPLLRGFFSAGPAKAEDVPAMGKAHDRSCHRREALLLALKPYLSPARCAAVDYFIRLARVGDAIRSLQ